MPDTTLNPPEPETRAARSNPGPIGRFLRYPATWAIIGIVVVAALDASALAVGTTLGLAGQIVGALVGGVAAVLVYRIVMRRLAGRAVPELRARDALRRGMLGAALGAGFILASIGLVAALGGFVISWHPVDAASTVALAIGTNAGTAAVEEIVFRGFAFQAIEQAVGGRRGSWAALVVTAFFFGGAHLLNPAATLWSGFAIAIEAGVLTGAAFMWRRNLWFVMGIHFAWNALEGLSGIAVSGHRDPGLLVTVASGPSLISGGSFGVEASVVPVLLSVVLSTVMLLAARRRPRTLR